MINEVNFGVLILFGIGIFGGILGAYLFKKIHIPQVVGYIIIGLLIGESGLHIIKHQDSLNLQSFNWFALGIIGFLVGGELKIEAFKKYGKQFAGILLGEGLGAFFLVGIPVTIITFYIAHSFPIAAAAGIVFGAIASATDPASTVGVLWEYRAKGPLTTALIATVALDDALALTLYGVGTSIAHMLIGDSGSLIKESLSICKDLFGSILMGICAGLLLNLLIKHLNEEKEKILAIAIGILLIVIGAADALNMDVILVTMSMGLVLVNLAPKRSEELFLITKNFSTPIYVMFFVLVGARLNISNMPNWLWAIVAIYVLGRSIGKAAGAYLGAKITNAEKNVRNYTGIGLFAQGGVAIGLSIMASQHLSHIKIVPTLSLGDMIIFGITATTFIVQLAGPPLVKLAIRLSGEIDKNVTEEDIIKSLTVGDVMDTELITIAPNEQVSNIFQLFAKHKFLIYPIVDKFKKVIGTISLDNLKDVLTDQECWEWLVAADMITDDEHLQITNSTAPLKKILKTMSDLSIEQMPVTDNEGNILGILDRRNSKKTIQQELIKRQSHCVDSKAEKNDN